MDWQVPYLAYNPTHSLPWHPYLPIPNRWGHSFPSQPYISYPSNPTQYPAYQSPSYQPPSYQPPSYQPPSYPNYPPPPRRYPTTYTQSSLPQRKRTRNTSRRRRRSSSTNRPLYPQASGLERSWKNVTTDFPSDAPVFTLLCYNLLSQFLLEEHKYLYEYCSPLYCSWDYRKYYLLQQLVDSTADIFCLQEVDEEAYNSFFSPNLKAKGFDGFYKRRTGEHTDGIAVFYSTYKFEIVTYKLVEYKRNNTLLDRDNVGVILKLRLKGDGDNFLYVATTHILFNPKAGHVKLGQVCVLLSELRELTSQDKDSHPLILCGDMNCLPNSCLYYFLRSGYLNYKFLLRSEVSGYKKPPNGLIPAPLLPEEVGISNACRKVGPGTELPADETSSPSHTLSHPYSFYSAYPHSLTEPSLVSTYHGSAFENVDYIFYSCPVLELKENDETFKTSRELKLVSRYSLPPRDNIRSFGPLPNKFHSSDHLQLVAKFCYIT